VSALVRRMARREKGVASLIGFFRDRFFSRPRYKADD